VGSREKRMNQDIGFIEEQCFKLGVIELWRDSKWWGFGEYWA